MLVKNIPYEKLRADFDKIYSQFYKIEITEEFHKALGDELSLSLYHEKIGSIFTLLYIRFSKENVLD